MASEPAPAAPVSGRSASEAGSLRALLLGLVGLGAAGLVVELALLEHWEELPQYAPFLVLAPALAAAAVLWRRPGRGTLRAFQGVMALAVLAGMAGIGFHFQSNWAFEREIVPEASTAERLWETIHGATPLLAPGSLVQLGLVGLALTYGHPAARIEPDEPADAGTLNRLEPS